MRKLLVTATFVMLMAGPAAVAQTGNSSGKQTPWPAPVGHRQPRADQVPSEKDLGNNTGTSANDAMKREDAELDRKLKSICRGC